MSSNGRAVPSTQKNHSSFVKKQSSSRLPDQNPNPSPRTYHTTKSARVAALPTHDVGNSLNGSRKRLPHLSVSSSTHSSPEQFSPSKSSTAEPYTPIQHSHIASPLFASPHTYERTPRNSPQKPSPDQSLTYRPLYTNSQSASPLETPHNPYFDPNRSLASQTGHQEPSSPRSRRTFASEHYSSFPEPYSPTHVVRNESSQGASEPLSNRGIQSHHFADASYAPANAQADPSLLKSQFQATYLASPSNSNSAFLQY
ncbi:hypothetical protein DFH11DRAFT_39571 [Phellopilus nigrolimitatus]|nr:hypothetical protein DFH11DRAFT_39571 [Phellopilus nigrolimitatus]